MGFCGLDDSMDPQLALLLSTKYTWIEWGVLFRPDLEGTPRYASADHVKKLCAVNMDCGSPMRLAGHLCGQRCQEVIDGDWSFVEELSTLGFGRVQVNATKANFVTVLPEKMAEYISNLRACMAAVPQVEWIIQRNEETTPIWSALSVDPPSNMSFLFDASCGLGVFSSTFPPVPTDPYIPCGYAGGIGASNVAMVLDGVAEAAGGKPCWIDMESSLREAVTDKNVSFRFFLGFLFIYFYLCSRFYTYNYILYMFKMIIISKYYDSVIGFGQRLFQCYQDFCVHPSWCGEGDASH
jgi:hypothetical protein